MVSGSKVAFAGFVFLNSQNIEKSKEESELHISLLLGKNEFRQKRLLQLPYFSLTFIFNHFKL